MGKIVHCSSVETKSDLGVKIGFFVCFIYEHWSAFALVMLHCIRKKRLQLGNCLVGLRGWETVIFRLKFSVFSIFVWARKLETN